MEITYLGANQFNIADLGSKNGLLINGSKTEKGAIQDGDTIEIGEVRLTFVLHPTSGDNENETVFMQTQMDAQGE